MPTLQPLQNYRELIIPCGSLRFTDDRRIPALPILGRLIALAVRAEVGTASAYHNALDGRTAIGAVLANAVGDIKLVVGSARFTVGADIIPYAGALFIKSFPQYFYYRSMESFYFGAGKTPRGL